MPGQAHEIVKWSDAIAKSVLHKAVRRAEVELAAFAAAWLMVHGKKAGIEAAWRCILAFAGEDLCGEGADRIAALHYCWKEGHECANLFASIINLCRLVKPTSVDLPDRAPGQLLRSGDELKNAALVWIQGGDGAAPREIPVPDYALDHHNGFEQTADKWWDHVNVLGPASPWRADAVRVKHR